MRIRQTIKHTFFIALVSLFALSFQSLRADETIRIMTFNVPHGNIPAVGLNTWEGRAAAICKFLGEARPDLLGMQEPILSELSDLLRGIPGYTMIGVARDDGAQSGEYSPIIYRTDRFLVEKSGTYWLSLTPDKVSKDWNSACRRIATWAVFRDRHNGARFLYTNTHLDHVSSEAKYNQIRVIKEKMKAILDEEGNIPAFLTGDFNSTESEAPIGQAKGYLTQMKDAYTSARNRHGVSYTFPSSKLKIDFIFATSRVKVSDAWIHNSYYDNGQILSDHNAHYADLSWSLSLEERTDSLIRVSRRCIDSLTVWKATAEKLLTNASSQLSSDGKYSGSSYSQLIDGSTTSSYYSAYSAPLPPAGTHFISCDLGSTSLSAATLMLRRGLTTELHDLAPEEIRVYSSADGSAWQYVTDLSSIAYSRTGIWTSPTLVMPYPARYLRFYVTRTPGMNIVVSGPRFALSDMQLYRAKADTARSQRLYDPAISRAVDTLLARCESARAVTSTTSLTGLQSALDELRALYIPIAEYEALLAKANYISDTNTPGTKIGQTTEEASQRFKAGIAEVKKALPEKGSRTAYTQAINSLSTLLSAFESSLIAPEAGKWYYLNDRDRIRVGTMRGRFLHSDSIDISAPLKAAEKDAYGDNLSGTSSPYAMWRFVSLGKGKGYALQNRGTGYYLGQAGADSIFTSSTVPVPVSLSYPAAGEVNISTSSSASLCLAATSDGTVRLSPESGTGSAAAWEPVEVPATQDSVEIRVRSNSISILCLPFPVSGISARNPRCKAYTVSSVPSLLPYVNLSRRDSFAAGEPFVLLCGTPEADSNADSHTEKISLPAPDSIVTAPLTRNGLHGLLSKAKVPASLYFEKNILRNHTSPTTLEGGSGYLVRSEASTTGAAPDLTVNINTLVNAISPARISHSGDKAVYTIDGLRLPSGATPAKGIYIKEGKKILVK